MHTTSTSLLAAANISCCFTFSERNASGIISGQGPPFLLSTRESKEPKIRTGIRQDSELGTIPCQSAVMVMRKLGPCRTGHETGIKFLITSPIMIYPPPNRSCGPFTSVQFQRPRPSGGKNPRFVTQMSKPIFPAKRARFDSRSVAIVKSD